MSQAPFYQFGSLILTSRTETEGEYVDVEVNGEAFTALTEDEAKQLRDALTEWLETP